jgi:prepilin-type N-terminal cleavage/methylation domain-containing protein
MSSKAKKFSLIELIVVISIFSIIASLLQPALKDLISQSHQTECRYKLKQIGTIVMIYTQDNDDQLPGPCTGRIFAWERPSSMLQFVAEYADSEPFIQNPYFPPDRRLASNYRSYKQFMCPSNMDQTENDGNNVNNYFSRRVSYFTGNKYGTFRGTRYENHIYENYFGDGAAYDPITRIKTRKAFQPYKLSDIPDPSYKVLAFDYDIQQPSKNSYFSIAPIHEIGGGRNVLLFDLRFITQNSFTLECYD